MMKCQPWHLKTDHHDDCVRAVDGAGFVILPPCQVRISRVREIVDYSIASAREVGPPGLTIMEPCRMRILWTQEIATQFQEQRT